MRFPGARYRVNRSHARAGPIAGSFPILSLRTNKADVICGVEQAVADRLDGTGEKWRYNGKWVHDSFMVLHGIFDRLPVSRVPGTPSCSSSRVRIREKYRREVLWCRMFYQHRCTIRPYTARLTLTGFLSSLLIFTQLGISYFPSVEGTYVIPRIPIREGPQVLFELADLVKLEPHTLDDAGAPVHTRLREPRVRSEKARGKFGQRSKCLRRGGGC